MYIQYIQSHTHTVQHWEGPHSPQPEQKWPSARAVHSAACLVDPLCDDAYTQQQLLVLWGEDSNAIHVKDIWILHIYTMTWKEVSFVIVLIIILILTVVIEAICHNVNY